MNTPNTGKIVAPFTTTRAKAIYAGTAVVLVASLVFLWSWSARGPVSTVVYTFLFLFAFALLPTVIALFGAIVPNGIGKLHMVLGAVAFDHHFLVQREHGWEWCPGGRTKQGVRVWIDDDWHDVEGEEHLSMLAWRPFGVLRYKDDGTWADERVDEKAIKQRDTFETDPTATDGGQSRVERGSIPEVAKPNISGTDGTWLLDLKRMYTRGVKRIGDTSLIETAEEVIERGQAQDGGMGGLPGWAQTMIGLVMGLVGGYLYIFLA